MDIVCMSAAVLGATVVVATVSAAEVACVVVSVCAVVIVCVVGSVIISVVVSVLIVVMVVLMGVLSAFGAKDGLAAVEVAPLISNVLIVSAFGFSVVVVSSLFGEAVLASSRAGRAVIIASVVVVPSLLPAGLSVVEFASLELLLVSGASVGNWSFSKSKP